MYTTAVSYSYVSDSYVHFNCTYNCYGYRGYSYVCSSTSQHTRIAQGLMEKCPMSQPTHQDSSKFNGQASLCPPETTSAQSSKGKRRYVRQNLYQLKVQRTNIAVSARNYISSKFKGQMSLCPPETMSAQSSMVKRRYVHQKLYQLKVQRTRQPKFTWCSFGNTKGN